MSGFDEDTLKQQVIEKWSQGGGNWPVKVMPANRPNANSDSVIRARYECGREHTRLP